MAKIYGGYMGGFSGKLGPAVGYMWKGRWCVRSHNPYPHNPRTWLQTAHRDAFKGAVQLAAAMRWAVTTTLTETAREWGMTSYNVFVHLNHRSFSTEDRELRVDWASLKLTAGDYECVEFGCPVWTADNVLTVPFERGSWRYYDRVQLYVYCPDLERGFLCAPVDCRTRKVSVMLPGEMAGSEVHVYGFVHSMQGAWSETAYVGCLTQEDNGEETAESEAVEADNTAEVAGGSEAAAERQGLPSERREAVTKAPPDYPLKGNVP